MHSFIQEIFTSLMSLAEIIRPPLQLQFLIVLGSVLPSILTDCASGNKR